MQTTSFFQRLTALILELNRSPGSRKDESNRIGGLAREKTRGLAREKTRIYIGLRWCLPPTHPYANLSHFPLRRLIFDKRSYRGHCYIKIRISLTLTALDSKRCRLFLKMYLFIQIFLKDRIHDHKLRIFISQNVKLVITFEAVLIMNQHFNIVLECTYFSYLKIIQRVCQVKFEIFRI